MQHSLIAKLISLFLLYPLFFDSALSKDLDHQLLSSQLEENLNHNNRALLKDLFLQTSFKKFDRKYLDFKRKYKDAKWLITMLNDDLEKPVLDVQIKSKTEINDQIYNLNTKQTVQIETFKNKIKSYQVINEESILSSQKSPLAVKIISPDNVLTGERYEINLIIEKPLDNSLIASGMIVLKNNETINISNDSFGLKPNLSGGLFKYVQAPLEPGYQIISAIITHPEGIYSITKKIKVGL